MLGDHFQNITSETDNPTGTRKIAHPRPGRQIQNHIKKVVRTAPVSNTIEEVKPEQQTLPAWRETQAGVSKVIDVFLTISLKIF